MKKERTDRGGSEAVPDAPLVRPELAATEMPFEGLAAYWLSLKKLLDEKKDPKFLRDEARHTGEKFIRLLLETAFSELDEAQVRRLADARRRRVLHETARALDLVRSAVRAITAGENPSLTLVGMLARFDVAPIAERRAMELAQALVAETRKEDADKDALLAVDLKMKPDRLLVKLCALVILSRRDTPESCRDLAGHVRLPMLAEALSQIADGFDPDFIDGRLAAARREHFFEAGMKLSMCVEMCLAIRQGLSYEGVYLAARAFLP